MNNSSQILIENYIKAFANSDTGTIIELVTDYIRWEIVGDQIITGKYAFEQRLNAMAFSEPNDVRIDRIITHDKDASVNGVMTTPDGQSYAFCDIITFNRYLNPKKIQNIKSYSIELKNLDM